MGKVLIIEDSEDLRFALSNVVKKEGYTAFEASTGSDGLDILEGNIIDLVFLDIGLPDISGLELISRIRDISRDTEIVVITGMDDARTAVFALKSGVADYMLKPFELIEFKNILNRMLRGRLAMKLSELESAQAGIEAIVGKSGGIAALKDAISVAAGATAAVLITGETGTGKELVARAVHNAGDGRKGIFVKVDCGTLSGNIIESELFGHVKGSFTDAKADKKGLIEMADGGTLFLDEIGTLPIELQPKLLRLVEESVFRKVGGLKDIHADIRVISATNLDLKEQVRKGLFREDLFFRLNVIALEIPPLRERGDDILLVADFFLGQFGRELKRDVQGFSPDAESALKSHRWPGNVRELRNCIERAVIYSKGGWLTSAELNIVQPTQTLSDDAGGNFSSLADMELAYIKKVLKSVGGNRTLAAKTLGISRTTLREKLKADSYRPSGQN